MSCVLEVTPQAVGDLDGDGLDDVLFVDRGCDYVIDVHLSPEGAGTEWWYETDVTWTAPIAEWYGWMPKWVSGGDFDQDGRDDFIGTEGNADSAGSSFFDVFFGGTWGEPSVRIGTTSERYTACETMDLLGDLDGDGAPEVHAEGNDGYKYILSGADLAGADGQVVEDLAIANLYGVQEVGGQLTNDPLYETDDWTGDGLDDVLVWAPLSETSGERQRETFLVDGAQVSGEFFLADAVGSWVGAPGTDGADIVRSLEFDGELGNELILYDGETTYVVRHETPTMRTEVDGLRFQGTGTLADVPGPAGDLDADGYQDWFLYDLDARGSGVLLGWPVPWDEPEWWTSSS